MSPSLPPSLPPSLSRQAGPLRGAEGAGVGYRAVRVDTDIDVGREGKTAKGQLWGCGESSGGCT